MRRIRCVAYAVNGSGLGHLTRVLAILRWSRRLARLAGYEFDAYVLTSSEGSALALEEGFAAFKIPSKTAVRAAEIPKPDYLRLARQWVWHSLGLVDPDLLVVDTFPGGSFGELIHALDGPRARVFVYRRMRDEFARTDTVQAMLPFYDSILVPVEPGCEPHEVPPALSDRAHPVGPIILRSREELHDRATARRRLGVPEDRLALWLSAGGGGDPTAESTLTSLARALSAEPDLHLVVGAGSLYRGEPVRAANVTWLQGTRAVEDFLGLDAAISAAGYNSFHELLHAGVPSAFFAQEKIADEQARRVAAAASAGAALALATDASGAPDRADLDRVLAELRDPERRARLRAAAEAFVPANFALDAAALTLATIIPQNLLDEARDTASPALFARLERYGVTLDAVLRVLRVFERTPDLDGEDRGEIVRRFVDRLRERSAEAARLFPLLASRLAQPSGPSEAAALTDAVCGVLDKAADFGDERAVAALLRMLPAEREVDPTVVSDALSAYLAALADRGESLWRALGVLGRALGAVGSERPLVDALTHARHEIAASRIDLETYE